MKPHFALSISVVILLSGPNVAAQQRRKGVSKPPPARQDSSKTGSDLKTLPWLSPECSVLRLWFEKGYPFGLSGIGADVYSSYTRQKALSARQRVVDSPDWDALLPCCPETGDVASVSPFFVTDYWPKSLADRKVVLSCFHPGAYSDFRTSDLYHRVTEQSAGQQCTYDQKGNLIPPNQPGAGTPDFISPTVSDEQHLFFDVFPWTKLSLSEYDSAWKPDPGCNRVRTLDFDPTMINLMFLYVKRGDVISISATGKVKFDVEGNETGPEGSLVIPKTDVGILGRLIAPNPLPTAPPGALLGGVYTGELKSMRQFMVIDEENLFYVGKGGNFRMPATGYFAFTLNDGYLPNNSGNFSVSFYRKVAR